MPVSSVEHAICSNTLTAISVHNWTPVNLIGFMAPSQRYYASSTSNILHASEDGQDDADDFMSDKFVSAAASASAKEPMSYTQLRKEALRRKEERGYTKSRAEREKEAREQGLRRNILETTSSTTTSIASPSTSSAPTPPSVLPNTNKALGMMLRMGFKPGEALGKKTLPMSADLASASPSAEEEDADDGFIPLKEGTGSKRSASNALADPGSGKDRDQVDDRRIDPIEIQMRSGQADFTTCSLHLTQLILHTFITRDGVSRKGWTRSRRSQTASLAFSPFSSSTGVERRRLSFPLACKSYRASSGGTAHLCSQDMSGSG